jgi:hypothetical protein
VILVILNLGALCLLGRCCTTWATSPALICSFGI